MKGVVGLREDCGERVGGEEWCVDEGVDLGPGLGWMLLEERREKRKERIERVRSLKRGRLVNPCGKWNLRLVRGAASRVAYYQRLG